ncbi:hypothetical protein [Streptomyces sp. NPDC048428]|uniref:hypothetical protein n=1 Tax=Streptomyces sp. NPDC048428 TaxID=3154503 RepID=UPI00342B4731
MFDDSWRLFHEESGRTKKRLVSAMQWGAAHEGIGGDPGRASVRVHRRPIHPDRSIRARHRRYQCGAAGEQFLDPGDLILLGLWVEFQWICEGRDGADLLTFDQFLDIGRAPDTGAALASPHTPRLILANNA